MSKKVDEHFLLQLSLRKFTLSGLLQWILCVSLVCVCLFIISFACNEHEAGTVWSKKLPWVRSRPHCLYDDINDRGKYPLIDIFSRPTISSSPTSQYVAFIKEKNKIWGQMLAWQPARPIHISLEISWQNHILYHCKTCGWTDTN